MSDLNQNLFGQTYEQLIAQGIGATAQNFQLLGSPIDYSWKSEPKGTLSPVPYLIASRMPEWSPVGTFGANRTLYDAYRNVFGHLQFDLSPDQRNAANKLQSKLTDGQNLVTEIRAAENQAYLTGLQNGGRVFKAKYPTIEKWLETDEAENFERRIKKALEDIHRTQDLLLEIQMAQQPAELKRAMEALIEPTSDPGDAVNPPGWVKVADGGGILRWQPSFILGGPSGEDWRAKLTDGSQGGFHLVLEAGKSSSSFEHSWSHASVSRSFGFFSASVSASWDKLDIAESDDSVRVEIGVESSMLVPVAPGEWFHDGFLANVARNEHTPISSGFSLTPPWKANGNDHALFGENGLLKTQVTGLVVAYQPSFKVTMRASTFDRHRETLETSGGVSFGPIRLGGASGGFEKDYQHRTSGGTTFEGGSTSEDPLIIGVTVGFPGVDKRS